MQLPVLLDRSRDETLTSQLVSQLRDAIRRDMIPGGTRLPSSRRLADQLAISRNTAVRAYDILVLEGYAESRPASGIFAVKPAVVPPAPQLAPQPGDMAPPRLAEFARRRLRPGGETHRLSFDFVPGRGNAGLFPARTWRRLLLSKLARGGTELGRLGDPGGLYDLRAALSHYLSATRGMVADPARIIITHGAQEALALAAHTVLSADVTVVAEDPCYAGAVGLFEAAGAEIVGVPVDAEGLRVDALPARAAALLYVTPAHQYPTGRVLAVQRRHAIVDWARRHGCIIVEDDYDGDIRYEGSPLPAIAGLAPDRTIHIGSVTTTLGAGLRIGFMVVPPALLERVLMAKALHSHAGPWLEQAALAEFIQGGGYAMHVARLRAAYHESRDILLAALTRHFGEVDVSGEQSGLHLLWHLPPGMPEAGTLELLARRARVGIYPLSAAGVVDLTGSSLSRRGVLLGYASLTPRQILDGIARLSDAVDDRLDGHHEFLRELLPHEPGPATIAAGAGKPAASLRRRLALSATSPARPVSRRNERSEDAHSMAVVSGIYRYPVKGLSGQALHGVRLEPGRPLPFDRVFALARHGARIDPQDPKWAKKGLFVMLMLDEALASVRTVLDVKTMRLSVTSPEGAPLLESDLDSARGRAATEAFFAALVPSLEGPPTLVRSRESHFMDKPDNVISLINLATLRSLEERWGHSLDKLRFRANLYIDGARPWEEFDWVGSKLRIGETVMRVDRRNGRCGATNVDPWTGRRDRDLPAALRAAFGHKDLGVYLVTEQAGSILVGDTVAAPGVGDLAATAAPVLNGAAGGSRSICRGCYYVYDESLGVPGDGIPPGTAFADLPQSWRCPDCGTDRGKFRPYVGASQSGGAN